MYIQINVYSGKDDKEKNKNIHLYLLHSSVFTIQTDRNVKGKDGRGSHSK